MSNMEIIQAVGFSMPLVAAMVCCAILAIHYRTGNNESARSRLTLLMIFTLIMAVFCWSGIVLYVISYDGFVWFNTLFFLALMLDQVLLYHFMFIITGTGNRLKFNKMHYAIPIALTLAMGIWSLLTPYEVQYYIVESRGENAPGYLWYSRFFSATVPIFIVCNIFYPLAGLLRVRRYRKEVVNYSADEQRASVSWLYQLVFLIWFTLPIASITLFVHKQDFFNSALTAVGAFLPIFQYIVICYNLVSGNYVIIQPPAKEEPDEGKRKLKTIDRARFERYMKERKPYLNPGLKISDISADLGTNRSYLSAFINQEYGMNFSRYINRRRLEEIDRLRTNPQTAGETGIELVMRAGFSNFQGYLRVKNEEDRKNALKVFE